MTPGDTSKEPIIGAETWELINSVLAEMLQAGLKPPHSEE